MEGQTRWGNRISSSPGCAGRLDAGKIFDLDPHTHQSSARAGGSPATTRDAGPRRRSDAGVARVEQEKKREKRISESHNRQRGHISEASPSFAPRKTESPQKRRFSGHWGKLRLAPAAQPPRAGHTCNRWASCRPASGGTGRYGENGLPACGRTQLRPPTPGATAPTTNPC